MVIPYLCGLAKYIQLQCELGASLELSAELSAVRACFAAQAGTTRSCFTAWRGAHEDARREAERLRHEEALSAQHAHTPRMLQYGGSVNKTHGSSKTIHVLLTKLRVLLMF